MPRPADALPVPETADHVTDFAADAVPGDAESIGLHTGREEEIIVNGEKDPDALAADPRSVRAHEATDHPEDELESSRKPADDGHDQGGDNPGDGGPRDAGGEEEGPVTARDLGLIGNDHPEHEQERLAHARAAAIKLGRIGLRLENRAQATEREQLRAEDASRLEAAHFLNDEHAVPRGVVRREEARVQHLLAEPEVEPRTGETGHGLFSKIGSRLAEGRQQAAHDRWEDRQDIDQAEMLGDLDFTREMIRSHVVGTPDEGEIDNYIGLREQGDTILPDHFKRLHHAEEARLGQPISFLAWASTYASDGQLQNVWQWHDHYLRTRDSSPEYQAQVERVTSGYGQGLEKAITAGEIHPTMGKHGRSDGVTFRHDSPFSPIIAVCVAYDDEATKTVFTRDNVEDYWLYHERAHQHGGFGSHMGEGATELVASTIYDHAHETEPPRDLRLSPYWDNILTIASLNNVAEGKIGLFGLTQFYAASNNIRLNTLAFMQHSNNEAGLFVNDAVNNVGRAVLSSRMQQTDLATVRFEMFRAMRQEAAFYEAMLVDEQGRRIPQTLDELAERMKTQETVARYGVSQIRRGLETIEFTRMHQDA
jgi:hypothetical protein